MGMENYGRNFFHHPSLILPPSELWSSLGSILRWFYIQHSCEFSYLGKVLLRTGFWRWNLIFDDDEKLLIECECLKLFSSFFFCWLWMTWWIIWITVMKKKLISLVPTKEKHYRSLHFGPKILHNSFGRKKSLRDFDWKNNVCCFTQWIFL